MILRAIRIVGSAALLLTSMSLASCSDDDKKEEEPEHEHEPTQPSCVEILDSCHAADEGTGPAHDCHELAHFDSEADCAAQKDDCIAICAM